MDPSIDSDIRRARAFLEQNEPARALECLQPLLETDSPDARILATAGRALNNLDRLDEAADALRRASEVEPQDADTLANLGHVLARLQDREGAEDAWQRALALAPDHLRSLRGLARLCANSRRLAEAAGHARRVAELAPEDLDNWLNLAELCQFLEEPGNAEAAYRRAATLAPRRADVHLALGRLLYSGGDVEGAERAYARTLALESDHGGAAAGRALCLEILGRRDEGLALLAPFLAAESAEPVVDYAAGRLLAGAGRADEAARHLARATESTDPHWRRNPQPWYEHGRVLETLGRLDEAFEAWSRANRLKPVAFDVAAFERRVETIITRYPGAGEAATGAGADLSGPRPLFIVGMPRTGTTLVEQMLACHPQVMGGGERLILETMAGRLWRRSERARPADADDLESMRRKWHERIGPVESGVAYYTDKFPGNFLHLGLAHELLPELEVIWCRRDAADTALSIFATDFNRKIVPWATRLDHIATMWNAHERLMAHWRDALGLPVTEMRYEALIDEPERELRRLLAVLGLPWDAACLSFHESERLANTASFDQVRRPLYASSVGRGRRFGQRLDPFLSALTPQPPDTNA
jgi:tetratricopeptide (TPR) repeat protein